MEPEGSLPCSQEPSTGPYMSQMNPVHTPHLISLLQRAHNCKKHKQSSLDTIIAA
jgi:hypothetical protein